MCNQCNRREARPNRTKCQPCTDVNKAARQAVIDAGVCRTCRGPRDDEYTSCSTCRAAERKRRKDYAEAKKNGTLILHKTGPKKYKDHYVNDENEPVCKWCYKLLYRHRQCERCTALIHSKRELKVEDHEDIPYVMTRNGRLCTYCDEAKRLR